MIAGALVTGIAPTATALAGYFCISDLILISQCVYYNTMNARKARQRAQSSATDASEDEPLLRRQRTGSSTTAGLPGSRRRESHHQEMDPIKRIITGEDETTSGNAWLNNLLGIMAIWIVGTAGWFLSYRAGAWDKPEDPGADEPNLETPVAIVGMILGYASALCYLW